MIVASHLRLQHFKIHYAHPQTAEKFIGKLSREERIYYDRIISTSRKNEFLLSRLLVRDYSLDPQTISNLCPGSKGYINWPSGTTGSISHKQGTVAACIEHKDKALSIGLDIENLNTFPPSVENKICTSQESKLVEKLVRSHKQCKAMILGHIFSIKEALFKCLYPLEHIWFNFKDAELEGINFEEKTFTIKTLKSVSKQTVSGTPLRGYFDYLTYEDKLFLVSIISLNPN